MKLRVGQGYDVHRFAPGRRLVLGGVEIAHERGLLGHSDADVLLHAMMDALLGAAGRGDIGVWFPPSDPELEAISSRTLLGRVRAILAGDGWEILNMDSVLIAEAPRIAPHTAAMKACIAEDLGMDAAAIGIKATSNESLGFIGRGEGIAALATALLYRKDES